jgi:N-acetylmuramoyl-L-alanine amidase
MIASVPLSKVDRIQIYINSAKKSLAEIKAATGADYIINGGLYNMTSFLPVCHLKVDGKVLASDPYTYWGYGWNDGADIGIMSYYGGVKNYICCVALIQHRVKEPLYYSSELGGQRGRSAIGLLNGHLILFCSKDGSDDAMTPEALQEYLYGLGLESAVMLDGGGSSQCDFDGQTITSTRKVHNYILVYLKKDGSSGTNAGTKKPKIYLSPSTQEANVCAAGDREEDHCNAIADELAKYLDAAGIEYQRNTRAMTHITSKDASNKYKPDLHYALHSNAYNGTVRGHRVYISGLNAKAKACAEILARRQAEIYGSAGKVIVPTERYTELFSTTAPAIIDEIAYHDNPEDAKWIHDNIKAIARNKAQAICEHFGVPFVEIEPPKPEPQPEQPQVLYRVQVGAFSNKSNAEALAQKLRSEGYQTLIQAVEK